MAKRTRRVRPARGLGPARGRPEELRKQGTAAKMGEAADQLEKNQMASARGNQEQARQELKDLVDSIQNRRERELARLVKELKNAEADLKKLRQRQAENLKKTREAAEEPRRQAAAPSELKKLAKEQAEIQKELETPAQEARQARTPTPPPAPARAPRPRWARPSRTSTRTRANRPSRTGRRPGRPRRGPGRGRAGPHARPRSSSRWSSSSRWATSSSRSPSARRRSSPTPTDYEKLRAERGASSPIAQRTGVRSLGRVQEGLKDETGELIETARRGPRLRPDPEARRRGDGRPRPSVCSP